MSSDFPHRQTVARSATWLSPWMVRRDSRLQCEDQAWIAAGILSVTVGLLNLTWLWLPVAVLATRGALVLAMWLRVLEARRRRRGPFNVQVLAAVPQGTVRRHPSSQATRGEADLLVGYLEATGTGWNWRPRQQPAGDVAHLDLSMASIQAATWSPTRQVLMPAASYLRIRTHAGQRYDFLVWDHTRVPPIAPHREQTTDRGDHTG